MVDISSQNNKINITVSSSGNTANTNVTPDYAQYYSEKSKEWAISDKIVDNTDYSSKYYANESKKQANISTAKTTEVIESGNTAVTNIESARDNAIIDITNQENLSVDNVNTAGATQVSSVNTAGITQVANVNSAGTTQINLAKEQVTLATNQANIATEQATIATNKASEVVESGNTALSNIDTAKTGAITDITNLKNTSISNITTAKDNAITSITTQETTSKNNVIATGNEQVERVNLTGVDNRTPIFTKSEIGTNEGVYQNIYDLKHSTFDKSKFTVVGSPTITDDGVASGFSSSNYLKTPAFDFSKPFTILVPFKLNTMQEGKCLFQIDGADGWWNYVIISADYAFCILQFSDKTTKSIEIYLSEEYSLNETYYLQTNFTGQEYSFKLLDKDKKVLLQNNYETTLKLYNSTNKVVNLGYATNGSGYDLSNGSIDLSHFSITVDGKEVFSGNKTGLDVIKSDNYTVVGSPVISEDGIASGFSSSNYLKNSLVKSDITDCEIHCRVVPYFDDTTTTGQYIFRRNSSDNISGLIGCYGNRRLFVALQEEYYGGFLFESGVTTDIILKLKDGVLSNYISTDYGATWTKNFEVENITNTMSFNNLVVGTGYYLWAGSIDLNAFKIYVDGNLVYQPCLKIPYTESKTGSKIVDVAYRDRVIDLYEQEGQAGYYTIDEGNKNFTLPMGEVYGMIEQKADAGRIGEQLANKADINTPSIQAPYLKDTYVNGTSGYRIWSDGYCEQWGVANYPQVPVNMPKSTTITFLKKFANVNYCVSHNIIIDGGNTTGLRNHQLNLQVGTLQFGWYSTTSTAGGGTFCWRASGYLANGQY